jgi:hypothetical protein
VEEESQELISFFSKIKKEISGIARFPFGISHLQCICLFVQFVI